MWYARDIKTNIITLLQSTSAGIEYYINTINTERGETTAVPFQVSEGADVGQYPTVYVDLGDSVITPTVGTDENTMLENFTLEVTAELMGSNTTKLKNDVENYVEAIFRTLQGYSSQTNKGSYICEANSVLRADIDTIEDKTKRVATVAFTVYSNQL